MPGRIEIDTGVYNPVLGRSYNEIAGISRSEHRSQAMGSPERRGPSKNFFTVIAGDPAPADVFDGVDITWKRIPGGAEVGHILSEAARTFSPLDPAKTIPLLLKARPLISRMTEGPGRPWAELKLRELDEAIAACAGLWLDVTADRPTTAPGSSIQVTLLRTDEVLPAFSASRRKVSGASFPAAGEIGQQSGILVVRVRRDHEDASQYVQFFQL